MKNFFLIPSLCTLLLGVVQATAYPENQTIFEKAYTNINTAYPNYLETVTDVQFDNKLTRISNYHTLDTPYPKVQMWNKDMSILKIGRNHFYNPITFQELPLSKEKTDSEREYLVGEYVSSDFRWSKNNPREFYGINHNYHFFKGTIFNNHSMITVLNAFNAYDKISLLGESNMDNNDRFVAFAASKKEEPNALYVIIYDIQNNTPIIEQLLPNISWKGANDNSDDLDWLSVSPKGDYLIVSCADEDSTTDNEYISLYQIDTNNRKLIYVKNLTFAPGHGDLGIDAEGNQVYVQFYKQLNKNLLREHGIFMYPIERDEAPIKLSEDDDYSFGGGHISCRNYQRPGWCYVSTKGEGYREIFAIKLDANTRTFERFAQTHYDSNPEGIVSPDGTKYIFQSNWGNAYPLELFITEAW